MASEPLDTATPSGLSVIMPFRNEQASLRLALSRLLLVDFEMPLQVILVDDGSTDKSIASIEDLLPRVELIAIEPGRGKGYAVRTGLGAASNKIVAVLDADLEYDPRDLVPLVQMVRDGAATVAYGSRPLSPSAFYSFWYMVGGRATSLWASLLYGCRVRDIHTSLKVAPRSVWNSLSLRCDGFDLDSEITAKLLRSGHRISEIPIGYQARSRAEGKKLRWTAGVKSLWVLTRSRFEPARDTAVIQEAQAGELAT
jgi:glycosyltransferase involved in cell wall biosynthesis